jgi:hypothetical protein
MRYLIAIGITAFAIGAAAVPARANQPLDQGETLATTQPRDATMGSLDRLAYDVDLSAAHAGRIVSAG